MNDDHLVAEVRKIRRDMLAAYGGDYQRMFRDMMQHQGQSGHRLVSCPGTQAGAADQHGARQAAESGRRKAADRGKEIIKLEQRARGAHSH